VDGPCRSAKSSHRRRNHLRPWLYVVIVATAQALFIAFAAIYLCYGGGFGTMPSFTADYFGAKRMGGIYGWILLA
jgi:hypothetical protein